MLETLPSSPFASCSCISLSAFTGLLWVHRGHIVTCRVKFFSHCKLPRHKSSKGTSGSTAARIWARGRDMDGSRSHRLPFMRPPRGHRNDCAAHDLLLQQGVIILIDRKTGTGDEGVLRNAADQVKDAARSMADRSLGNCSERRFRRDYPRCERSGRPGAAQGIPRREDRRTNPPA